MAQLQGDPGIRVLKFWTDYVPDGKGGINPVDKVEYCSLGGQNLAANVKSMREIMSVRPIADPENDLPGVFATIRRDAILPAYEAWKSGQEVPVDGTPLGAWPALSPEQVNLFRGQGIRTVEEVATMGEQLRSRVRLPNVSALVDQAKAFLSNKDKTALAGDLAEKDAKIKELQEQVAEMFALLSKETEPKRRGRPPKAAADEPDMIETEDAA
jgi:hypothetical protein